MNINFKVNGRYLYILGVFLIGFYYFLGFQRFNGFSISLGSTSFPSLDHILLWDWWITWSSLIILIFALVLIKSKGYFDAIKKSLKSDSKLAICSLVFFVFLASIFVRYYILNEMYITDDESAYIFSSELIANGHLKIPSFPMKHFFDRVFMINDSYFFAQYFYGWPAILAIGSMFKVSELVNPMLNAISVYLLYMIISHYFGRFWAFWGGVMYAVSPLTLVNSATFLTHSSSTCFFLLSAWFFIKVTRVSGGDTSLNYMLLALFSCIFFHIRPFTAVVMLPPIFILTLHYMWISKVRIGSFVGSISICVIMALLFFLLNDYLHDSPFIDGYSHYVEYATSNKFIFSYWNFSGNPIYDFFPSLYSPINITTLSQMMYFSLLRFSYDGIIFPSIFLLLVSLILGFYRVWWASVSFIFLLLGYAAWKDLGIDTYGPVHLSEGVPVAIILIINMAFLLVKFSHNNIKNFDFEKSVSYVGALFISMILVGFVSYSVIRINHVKVAAKNISKPYDAIVKYEISNAVVFSASPFLNQESIKPMRHFRFWRDNPSIDFNDDVLWVNDFGKKENLKFLKNFPGRDGYKMVWLKDGSVFFDKLSP